MAEAIVAVGLLGTAVQLVDAGIKVGKGVGGIAKGRAEILETYTRIQTLVSALELILPDIQKDIEIATIPDDHKRILRQLLNDCSNISRTLRDIIERGTQNAGGKPWRRYTQAYQLFSKDKYLQKLVDELFRCWTVLKGFHDIYRAKVEVVIPNRPLQLLQTQCGASAASGSMAVILPAVTVGNSTNVVTAVNYGNNHQQLLRGVQNLDALDQDNNAPAINHNYRTMQYPSHYSIAPKCTCSRLSLSYAWPRSFHITGWVAHESSCPSRSQRTGVSVWLASRVFRTAIKFDLDLTVSLYQGLSLHCNFTPVSIVPCVSPGFILAKKLQWPPWNWHSARKMIETMLETGCMTLDDVDPRGNGWLETVFEYQWELVGQNFRLDLLRFIIDHATALNHSRLLPMCLCLDDGSRHLDLIAVLIDTGVDFYSIEEVAVASWPRLHGLAPYSDRESEDPFFVKVLTMINNQYPGFGDSPAIQVAVMSGSMADVQHIMSKQVSLSTTNFHGQTVLHLAVMHPSILAYLLKDSKIIKLVNTGDKNGTTPLLYAAAYDQTASAILLLEAGADIWHMDDLSYGTFIHYALLQGHLKFLRKMIGWYLQQASSKDQREDGEQLCILALQVYLGRSYGYVPSYWLEDISTIFHLVTNPCREISNGKGLLHAVCHGSDCRLLLGVDGWQLNGADESGTTAFMVIVATMDPWSIHRSLALNADVNLRNHSGRDVLSHFMASARHRQLFHGSDLYKREHFDDLVCSLYLLLQVKDWSQTGDGCKCACSTNGCTSLSLLLNQGPTMCDNLFDFEMQVYCMMILLETVTILEEEGLVDVAMIFLRQLQRLNMFRRNEISHVCCASLRPGCNPLEEEDIAEILEEEDEMISLLNTELERLPIITQESCHQGWVTIIVSHFIAIELERVKQCSKFGNLHSPGSPETQKLNVEKIQVLNCWDIVIDRAQDRLYDEMNTDYLAEFLNLREDFSLEKFLKERTAQIEYSWSRKDSPYDELGIKRPDAWRESRLKMVEELRAEYARQKAASCADTASSS